MVTLSLKRRSGKKQSPWFPLDHSGDFVLHVPFSSNQGSAWFPWFSPGYGLNSNPASAESSENTKPFRIAWDKAYTVLLPASASLTSRPGRSLHCQRENCSCTAWAEKKFEPLITKGGLGAWKDSVLRAQMSLFATTNTWVCQKQVMKQTAFFRKKGKQELCGTVNSVECCPKEGRDRCCSAVETCAEQD